MPPAKKPTENTAQGYSDILSAITLFRLSLDQIDEKLETLREGVKNEFDRQNVKLDKVNELLSGNGSPEKGIIIRLDRQEQRAERLTWLSRTMVVAFLGSLTIAIRQWLTGK